MARVSHLFFIRFDVDDHTPDCPNMMLVVCVEPFYQFGKKEERVLPPSRYIRLDLYVSSVR